MTRNKIRRLELLAGAPPQKGRKGIAGDKSKAVFESERELSRQAEVAYRRLVSDWRASGPTESGCGRDTGARIFSALEGQSRAADSVSPYGLRFATSVARTRRKGSHQQRARRPLDFHPSRASTATPAKTRIEPASRPRETCSERTRPASSVAITIDVERTASTGAAAPRRSASRPSTNEPRFATAATAVISAELPPDRGDPDDRRVDEARPGEDEHEVGQRAGVLDPDAVDERVGGDRGRDRRHREQRASVGAPFRPAHEHDARRRRSGRRRPRMPIRRGRAPRSSRPGRAPARARASPGRRTTGRRPGRRRRARRRTRSRAASRRARRARPTAPRSTR